MSDDAYANGDVGSERVSHADRAYRVGAALAYLVGRMDTFCGVSGANVLMYKSGDIGGIPRRMPAINVIRAQARLYPHPHRDLYPDDHRNVLDAEIAIGDQETISAALEGFLDELEATLRDSKIRRRDLPPPDQAACC